MPTFPSQFPQTLPEVEASWVGVALYKCILSFPGVRLHHVAWQISFSLSAAVSSFWIDRRALWLLC